jgi:hypothetical protein
MNLICAGSRDLVRDTHCVVVAQAIEEWIWRHGQVTAILCGECRGADAFGKHWAETVGVPVISYRPDWERYGKAAGPFRNDAMVRDAHGLALVRFPDSVGSADVLRKSRVKGMPIVDVVLTRPR